jgi:hypothetical protein
MKHHTLARALLVCAVILLAISCVWSAHAQSIPALSTNLSGTITTTSTFQLIQGQNNGRKGCLIQNNGTHTMYVYFGAFSSATTAASAELSAGQAISCAINGNLVVQDAISIDGTSGDPFFANFQ